MAAVEIFVRPEKALEIEWTGRDPYYKISDPTSDRFDGLAADLEALLSDPPDIYVPWPVDPTDLSHWGVFMAQLYVWAHWENTKAREEMIKIKPPLTPPAIEEADQEEGEIY